MKPAFVITVHQSTLRPLGHKYLERYIVTLKNSLTIPFDIFVIENASDTYFEYPPDIHYHYLPDQNGGMTRAWNLGVQLAIENGNDFFCVTNEDLIFNNTINDFFTDISNHTFKDISIYGPVCDNPTTWPRQYSTNVIKNSMIDVTDTQPHTGIHGWFTGFSLEYWKKFNIDGNVFPPDKPWRGQEGFQVRDWAKGSKSFIVGSTLVHHEHTSSWSVHTGRPVNQPTSLEK